MEHVQPHNVPTDDEGFLVQDEANPAERHGWTRTAKGFIIHRMRPKRTEEKDEKGNPRTAWRWEKHSLLRRPNGSTEWNIEAAFKHFGLEAATSSLSDMAKHKDYLTEGTHLNGGERLLAGIDPPPENDELEAGSFPEHYYALHRRGKKHRMARVKAPAGGQITGGGTQTGGTFQKGGEFAPKPRQRIRDAVMAWLKAQGAGPERLAAKKGKKPAAGDLAPADLHYDKPGSELEPEHKLPTVSGPDDAIVKAKNKSASEAAGGDPGVVAGPAKLRAKLTIRELKDVEDSLKLPPKLQLTRRETNKDKTDGDEVGDLSLDEYYDWANGVARHMQDKGLTPAARERVRDPKHLSKAKLAMIIDKFSREAGHAKHAFADDASFGHWYGNHVAVMARHLHDSFHSGHPEDDDLWGKLDKKTGRVAGGSAITMAKLLVAATSGGMKPHENYDTAHAMIDAGRRAGGYGVNPFKSIPEYQYEDFSDWVNRAEQWHKNNKTGVTRADILQPGVSLKDRALWYERVMRPMHADKDGPGRKLSEGGTNSAARYSGVKAWYVAKQGPHYGHPTKVDKGKQGKKSPYPTTAAEPRYKTLGIDDLGRLTAPKGHEDYSAHLEDKYSGKGDIRTEKLPAVDSTGTLQPPGWTARNDQVLDGLAKINSVVSYFTHAAGGDERKGMNDAAKFFTTPQGNAEFEDVVLHTAGLKGSKRPTLDGLRTAKTAADVRHWIDVVNDWHAAHGTGVSPADVNTAARLFVAKEGNRGFYYAGDKLPGAFLLGPKFGAFSMNLHLDQDPSQFGMDKDEFHKQFGGHLTADLWWSRDWNVMLGSLFGEDDKRPKTSAGRSETPRGGEGSTHPERKLMRKGALHASQRAGLENVAQLQAVLWYYEQLKPQWFGVDTSSTSYLDGANLVAGRNGVKYTVDDKTGKVERVKS